MTYSHQNKGNICSNIMMIIITTTTALIVVVVVIVVLKERKKERMYNIFCVNIILCTIMMTMRIIIIN
jgi:hypothetical protein